MKVKELIELLKTQDPEMDVCYFDEGVVLGADSVGVYKGSYQQVREDDKAIFESKKGEYVGIGNPGDNEGTASWNVVYPIKDLITGWVNEEAGSPAID